MDDSNPELESFRQQWRAEVTARSKVDDSKGHRKNSFSQASKRKQPGPSRLAAGTAAVEHDEEEDDAGSTAPVKGLDSGTNGPSTNTEDIIGFGNGASIREPRSALEHYERAVERESQGSLGDSLNLYRKAFKMDSQVDKKYKSKHFPPSYFAAKANKVNPSNTSQTVLGTAHHSPDGPPQTIQDLLAGFQGLTIQPTPPEIEGMPAPPCPISKLPNEILVNILMEVAILDVASFVKLSQVCKIFAYMVSTEEQIWKRICLGPEVGFGGMHYKWQREITGEVLEEDDLDHIIDDSSNEGEMTNVILDPQRNAEVLLDEAYSSSWQKMFRVRPRIRFNGVYISTVNYIRPGQASPSQITWNSPVHIVTYYRYLRFFRDGTVISLLTTSEPGDVVHFLTKNIHETHTNGQGAHLPSAVMLNAAKGRWRLSTAGDNPEVDLKDAEGDVYVETEGVGKYIYRMELSLRSAGKGAKNNKLVWKGYWHYNKLSDDWGEFGLRNDKAFFWSRVKSYGAGE